MLRLKCDIMASLFIDTLHIFHSSAIITPLINDTIINNTVISESLNDSPQKFGSCHIPIRIIAIPKFRRFIESSLQIVNGYSTVKSPDRRKDLFPTFVARNAFGGENPINFINKFLNRLFYSLITSLPIIIFAIEVLFGNIRIVKEVLEEHCRTIEISSHISGIFHIEINFKKFCANGEPLSCLLLCLLIVNFFFTLYSLGKSIDFCFEVLTSVLVIASNVIIGIGEIESGTHIAFDIRFACVKHGELTRHCSVINYTKIAFIVSNFAILKEFDLLIGKPFPFRISSRCFSRKAES